MGIVHRGQRIPVVERGHPPDSKNWTRKQFNIGKKRFAVYGKRAEQFQSDLDVVRAHFGINKTEAMSVALHLVRIAIEKHQLTPKVPS